MNEQSIIITKNEKGSLIIHLTGFSTYEALGILRFQEKLLWMKMVDNSIENDRVLTENESKIKLKKSKTK